MPFSSSTPSVWLKDEHGLRDDEGATSRQAQEPGVGLLAAGLRRRQRQNEITPITTATTTKTP
jgi:hypothetical protein